VGHDRRRTCTITAKGTAHLDRARRAKKPAEHRGQWPWASGEETSVFTVHRLKVSAMPSTSNVPDCGWGRGSKSGSLLYRTQNSQNAPRRQGSDRRPGQMLLRARRRCGCIDGAAPASSSMVDVGVMQRSLQDVAICAASVRKDVGHAGISPSGHGSATGQIGHHRRPGAQRHH